MGVYEGGSVWRGFTRYLSEHPAVAATLARIAFARIVLDLARRIVRGWILCHYRHYCHSCHFCHSCHSCIITVIILSVLYIGVCESNGCIRSSQPHHCRTYHFTTNQLTHAANPFQKKTAKKKKATTTTTTNTTKAKAQDQEKDQKTQKEFPCLHCCGLRDI